MDFKSLLSQLDQLNETEGTTVHKGTYGNSYGKEDVRDQYGQRIGKVDKGAEAKKDAPKKGRGRPKKGADDSGEVKSYDTKTLGSVFGGGSKPKGEVGKKTVKHRLKEYFDSLDKAMNEAEQIQIKPASQVPQKPGQSSMPGQQQVAGQPKKNTQVIQQGNKTLGTVDNPQLAQQIKQSIGKGEMTLMPGEEMAEGMLDQIRSGSATPALNNVRDRMAQRGAGAPAVNQIRQGVQQRLGQMAGKPQAVAEKDEGKPGKNFAKIAKSAAQRYGSKEAGERVAGAVRAKLMKQGKIEEADLPPQDGLMGAGLGAGRSQGVAEAKKPDANKNGIPDYAEDGKGKNDLKKKTKVKEGMDHKLKAAHHAGKSHALSKQGYNCSYDDMEEARMYHEGFKEGLDECYGQVPIRGLVADESAQSTVDDMASFGAHTPTMEDDLDEVSRGEWLKQQAHKPGNTFKAFGQTFQDKDVLENDMFESWDNQLDSLLEEYKGIQEGMTVSISKGQQGSPDSVSVSAQDGEADQLLGLLKQAGLGLFGGDEGQAEVGVPAGADSHGGVDVVGDHDGMMALIKKSIGGDSAGTLEPTSSEDYADEEGGNELDIIKQLKQAIGGGHDHEHTDEATCNECGMMETQCGCDHDDKEMVDEVESEDQELYQVAEDNPPDSGEEEFAAMDQEVAADNEAASSHGGAVNSNLEEEAEEDEAEEDEAEEDEEESEEDLEESYANADDDGFEADIDFMTKMISGGLNKQKSTGQTTIPVIAGQNDREGYSVQESVADWKTLAGLK